MTRTTKLASALVAGLLALLAVPPAVAEVVSVDPLEARAAAGRVGIIAGLRVPFVPEGRLGRPQVDAQRAAIRTAREAVLHSLRDTDFRVRFVYDTVPSVALEVGAEGLRALRNSPHVASLQEDEVAGVALASTIPIVDADVTTADGLDGSGSAVVIVDTGVETSHPFLGGRVVKEACFTVGSACPGGGTSQVGPGAAAPCSLAGCNHGTHVAGIAAGANGTSGGITFDGVAPGASIIAVQVFERTPCTPPAPGTCPGAYTSSIQKALEWAYDLHAGAVLAEALFGAGPGWRMSAINLSLGDGRSYATNCDGHTLKPVMDNLYSAFVPTVVASGNDGFTNGLSAPACISTAVSVGRTTDADAVWGTSNSAAYLSLLAPGTGVVSSSTGGRYVSMGGTSMAAPHVTGAFAVLRESDPGAAVGTMLAALLRSGTWITDGRNGVRKPRINVDRAVESLGTIRAHNAATVTEGTPVAFRVTLSRPYDAAVTVQYRTLNGTAAAGRDYAARTGEIRFAPGERSRTVSITTYRTTPVYGSAGYSGTTLSFSLDLWGAVGANIARRAATGWIRS